MAQAASVDLHRASVDELKTLKGIGDVRAAAIVKGRPCARKDALLHKGIAAASVYEEILEQVTARQRRWPMPHTHRWTNSERRPRDAAWGRN